ncbi:hypothetical protein ACFVXC_35135 [Streptomyces sp. NPDC058257]
MSQERQLGDEEVTHRLSEEHRVLLSALRELLDIEAGLASLLISNPR